MEMENRMFTLEDIRNIAVQIERNGEETYHKAAQAATDPEIARTLSWMAKEERHHAQWFEKIPLARPSSEEQREVEEMGQALLQNMVKESTFLLDPKELEHAATVKTILTVAKSFEQDTIVFYEFLRELLDDESSVRHMKIIIEEERKHICELERLEKEQSRKG
jgi:rubrerythrin